MTSSLVLLGLPPEGFAWGAGPLHGLGHGGGRVPPQLLGLGPVRAAELDDNQHALHHHHQGRGGGQAGHIAGGALEHKLEYRTPSELRGWNLGRLEKRLLAGDTRDALRL